MFLRAWLGPTASIIPVAPEHIAFVDAAMKMRGYRSSPITYLGPKKHTLLPGKPGPHGTNWKQHKVYVPSHEVRGRPQN